MNDKEDYFERLGFSKELITGEIQKIFEYPAFATSNILKRFLSFIIDETLAGRSNQLKEYTIAVNVLSKPLNFNPQLDGIVRIHAGRLRRALHSYYDTTGRNDIIIISIPRGSYVPFFEWSGSALKSEKIIGETPAHKSIVLAVVPFTCEGKDAMHASFTEGLGELLSSELSRFQDISVIAYYTMRQIPARVTDIKDLIPVIGAQFIVNGNIQFEGNNLRIHVQLIDTQTTELVWSKVYDRVFSASGVFSIHDDIVEHVISELGDYCGLIVRHVATASKTQKTKNLDVYNAILWYYHFHSAFTAEAFQTALKAIEDAVKREPEYAMAWGCLGELYLNAYFFNYEISGNVYEKGLEFALKALQLDPRCQNAYVALALSHTYLRNKKECHRAIEQCIALNPRAITLIGMVGFLYITSGEHEKGFQLIEQSIKFNRFYPPWFNGGIAFYYLLHKDFELAYYWVKKMNLPGIAWDFLLRASALGHLNRIDEASAVIDELQRQHPGFPEKTSKYMNLLILNEELVNILSQGLQIAGMPMLIKT